MKLSVLRLRRRSRGTTRSCPGDEPRPGIRPDHARRGVGATNTGNNGLYVLLSLLLAILVVSGVVSRRNGDGRRRPRRARRGLRGGAGPVPHPSPRTARARARTAILVTVVGDGGGSPLPAPRPLGDAERDVELVFPRGGRQRSSRSSSSAGTRSASSARDAATPSRGADRLPEAESAALPESEPGRDGRGSDPPEAGTRGGRSGSSARRSRETTAGHPLAADRATGEPDRQGARLGAGARDRRTARNGPPCRGRSGLGRGFRGSGP